MTTRRARTIGSTPACINSAPAWHADSAHSITRSGERIYLRGVVAQQTDPAAAAQARTDPHIRIGTGARHEDGLLLRPRDQESEGRHGECSKREACRFESGFYSRQ